MLIKISTAKIRNVFELRYDNVLNRGKQTKIVMAVSNDLLTDRRVLRHAEALREAGYAVALVGRRELGVRCKRGWLFYAEYNLRLMVRLLSRKADVVWANDTDTLLACWLGARLKGRRLVMDAHELFPEVPEVCDRRFVKWVWATLERVLMPRCDAMLTVCQSIADYYRQRYGVEMAVVRNISCGKREVECNCNQVLPTPHFSLSSDKMLLYQGCVNEGRCVDWAIDALEWLPGCQLVVAGGGDLLAQMQRYAASKPWCERVLFTGRLMPDVLENLTRCAAVGLVMLEDRGLSYHFALPNRIGDFVSAGVPMVVSELPEMAAVVRRFGVGEVMEAPGAKPLAEAIAKVLEQWQPLDAAARMARFAEARADMDWQVEKQKLTALVPAPCNTNR